MSEAQVIRRAHSMGHFIFGLKPKLNLDPKVWFQSNAQINFG